jgi:hypothetical protein
VFRQCLRLAQSAARLDFGRLQTGAAVSFTRQQLEPAKLEIYRANADIRQISAGHETVQQTATGMDARAEIACSTPGGFCSSEMLAVDPALFKELSTTPAAAAKMPAVIE